MTFALLLRYWWVAVIAALVAVVGVQQVRFNYAQAETAKLKSIYAQAALKAEQEARAKETSREQEKQEIIDAANKQAEDAIAAVHTADVAADGLRKQLARYSAAVRANPSVGKGGEATESPLDLLSRMLARTDDAAGEFAKFADDSRRAGIACEKSYDSLK